MFEILLICYVATRHEEYGSMVHIHGSILMFFIF